MTARRAPVGLSASGRALWRKVTSEHELDAVQEVTLGEACRAKDRLEKLDLILRGDTETWDRLTAAGLANEVAGPVYIDRALEAANTTANLMKQLLASLRLTDPTTGSRPRRRGAARGAYVSGGTAKAGRLTVIDRARSRADTDAGLFSATREQLEEATHG